MLRCPSQGVAAQISAVPPHMLDKPEPGRLGASGTVVARQWEYPPTIFVHMSRDRHTEEHVEKDIRRLINLVCPFARITSTWGGQLIAIAVCWHFVSQVGYCCTTQLQAWRMKG